MVTAHGVLLCPGSESGKKLVKLLNEHSLVAGENDVIAFCYEEREDDAYISYNYSATKITVPRKDFVESDLEKDGFKIWRTWTYRG